MFLSKVFQLHYQSNCCDALTMVSVVIVRSRCSTLYQIVKTGDILLVRRRSLHIVLLH